MCRAERQQYGEGRTLSNSAGHMDRATKELDEFLHQSKADSTALDGASARTLHSPETVEQVWQLGSRNAGTGIAHDDFGAPPVGRKLHDDLDLAVERELERIRQKIKDDFLP